MSFALLHLILACAPPSEDSASPLPEGPAPEIVEVGQGLILVDRAGRQALRLRPDGGFRVSGQGQSFAMRSRGLGRSGQPLQPLKGGWEELPLPEALGGGQGPGRQGEGFHEWWSTSGGGLRQGWQIEVPPPGEGPLVLRLELEGEGRRSLEGGGLRWIGEEAELRYHDLRAWDAEGEPLRAWMELEGAELRLKVEDRGASYPVTVDPLFTTAAWTAMGTAGAELGWSVAGGGDLNGDGWPDWAASSDPGATGAVSVYLGSASLAGTAASTTLTGSTSSSRFGRSIAAAGDMNGDGYADLLVSTQYSSAASYTRGLLYYGSASGLSSSSMTALVCDRYGSYAWVASAGDINGDGYPDALVSSVSLTTSSSSKTCLYLGQAGTLSGVADSTHSPTTGSCGEGLGGLGDTNGDGYDDVGIGCPDVSSSSGRLAVYHGSASGLVSYGTISYGTRTSQYFGAEVEGIGDYDSDGYADFAVGAPGALGGGKVLVYRGGASGAGTSSADDLSHSATTERDYGTAIVGLDSDGDGDLEVLGGDPGTDALLHFEASAGVFPASASDYLSDPGSTTDVEGYGQSLAAADFNLDGYDDVLVGGPGGGTSDPGIVLMYLGGSDADGDGYFTGGAGGELDCDDSSALVNPGEDELPGDGVDQDCDGVELCYTDGDGDGYASSATAASADLDCANPGEASDSTYALGEDCADADAAVNPGASEQCDGANTDEDCDGGADDADPDLGASSGATGRYVDGDLDGHGSSTRTYRCDSYTGTAVSADDCDDATASTYSGAPEAVGDEVDSNCDGGESCYMDGDGDGYATASTLGSADADCQDAGEATAAERALGLDCADSSSAIHPAATEVCDAANTDEDCDGLADDADSSASAATRSAWYRDNDRDGYGDATSSQSLCDAPSGHVSNDDDCDDRSASVYPGATETVGDGVDSDCSGGDSCYADADRDGVGTAGATVASVDADCLDAGEATAAEVASAEDCDDDDASSYPGAAEVCDAADADNDCDGLAEDADTSVSRGTMSTWYRDADSDGHGDPATTTSACDAPPGYVSGGTDCLDSEASAHPGGDEVCDEGDVDEDCDGLVDDEDTSLEASSRLTWYLDNDGDGHGDPSATISRCAPPAGYVAEGDDCDDSDPSYHPGAEESDCGDLNDYNCDGSVSTDDADEDGALACEDCDDSDSAVGPHAEELCDGIDNDCSGEVDGPDATDASSWYSDSDGDGYGDNASVIIDCDQPEGTVAYGGDCDDSNAAFNPAAVEEDCSDPTDYNCDGYAGSVDNDGDGYEACEECEDGDARISPSASERCDGVDNNCDGEVDEGYEDVDGDGLPNCEAVEDEGDYEGLKFGQNGDGTCGTCGGVGEGGAAGLLLLGLGLLRRRRG